jgi:nitrate reductase NapE component
MLEEIKNDRITLILSVVFVLLLCVSVGMVGLLGFLWLNRSAEVAGPPPAESADSVTGDELPPPAEDAQPTEEAPPPAGPVADQPQEPAQPPAEMTEGVQQAYLALVTYDSTLALLSELPGRPADSPEAIGERLGVVIGATAILEAVSQKLEQEPPPGFEPAWETARQSIPVTQGALAAWSDQEVNLSQMAEQLPYTLVDQAVDQADRALVEQYGGSQADLDRMRAEAEAKLVEALE